MGKQGGAGGRKGKAEPLEFTRIVPKFLKTMQEAEDKSQADAAEIVRRKRAELEAAEDEEDADGPVLVATAEELAEYQKATGGKAPSNVDVVAASVPAARDAETERKRKRLWFEKPRPGEEEEVEVEAAAAKDSDQASAAGESGGDEAKIVFRPKPQAAPAGGAEKKRRRKKTAVSGGLSFSLDDEA